MIVGRHICALVTLAALHLAAPALPAGAACRQALVMALDVSGSVDDVEYALQLQGLATAFEDPDVQRALFEQPGVPVFLAVFEWSGQRYQRIIIDWRALDSAAAVAEITDSLRGWARRPAPEATSIGGALLFASETLARAPVCWKRTVDVSGDGKNNDWPLPQRIRETAAYRGVTINALVIGSQLQRIGDSGPGDVAELSAYFSNQVIQGPDAFVEVALGFENYAAAMTRKVLRELETATLGALPRSLAPLPARYPGLTVAAADLPIRRAGKQMTRAALNPDVAVAPEPGPAPTLDGR
jgi:hypothetical protein